MMSTTVDEKGEKGEKGEIVMGQGIQEDVTLEELGYQQGR
jgi:hypothetical protein